YMSIKDLLNARLKETQDPSDSVETIPHLQDTLNIQIDDPAVVSGDTIPTDESVVNTDNYEFDESAQESVEVKTDNYQFEDDATRERQPSESFLSRYMKAREKSRVTGPFPYESKFSADNLVASLVIDPLRGMGVLLETQ